MDQRTKQVSKSEHSEIELRLLYGVVSRASILIYLWATMATFYGLASIQLFQKLDPSITLLSNTWPRLVFNSVPMILIGYWYSSYKVNTRVKALSTIIIIPTLLFLATCIHALPAFIEGKHQIYTHFHATNIIVMFSAISLIAGSPKLVAAQIAAFSLIFFGPLLWIFRADSMLIQLILSDIGLISIALYVGLRSTYRLRLKLATEDVMRMNKVKPFLGKNLSEAIYESSAMEIEGYIQNGLILAVDLRGYTTFTQSNPTELVKKFMAEYHAAVSRILSENQGYLHKTSGDGLLVSFGVMEKEQDLSDLPNLESEEQISDNTRLNKACSNAIIAFQDLVQEFEQLKERNNIICNLLVGAGIASGEIEVVVRGDKNFRQELDIDGEPIVRAVRLETYSKTLNKMVDPESSFLVVSPELHDTPEMESFGTKVWMTNNETLAIRDYPEIESVLYRQWKHRRDRSQKGAA